MNSSTEMVPGEGEMIQDFLKEHKTKIINIFTEKIKDGIERGELRVDLKAVEVAEYLYALYNGIGVISKLEPTIDRLPFTLEMVRFALSREKVITQV